jgi:hypothetical protein
MNFHLLIEFGIDKVSLIRNSCHFKVVTIFVITLVIYLVLCKLFRYIYYVFICVVLSCSLAIRQPLRLIAD